MFLQVQEAALRQSPDIIVATPGRLIDHLRNSQSVHLEVCAPLSSSHQQACLRLCVGVWVSC
jgi:ATP-dependent RNA helicase DDX27